MVIPRHLLASIVLISLLQAGWGTLPTLPTGRANAQTRPARPLTAPPEITSESEKGGSVDLVFYIQAHHRRADGTQGIRAAGVHKGRTLGFEVVLGPTWRSGSLGNLRMVTYRGAVMYRSTGAESDAFVRVLDELYGTRQAPKAMRAETRFAGISLRGDPRNLGRGAVNMKLFLDDGYGDYAELYTNIYLAARRLEVHEKDESYRLQIVNALRRH